MPKKHLYYFRPCSADHALGQLRDRYRLIPINQDGGERPAWELPAVVIAEARRDILEQIEEAGPRQDGWRVIYLLDGDVSPQSSSSDRVFALLPHGAPRVAIEKAIEGAFESLRSLEERRQARRELYRAGSDLETLNRIGVALSSERNTDALLELVLTKSREITGADAGSLYLVEGEPGGARHLVCKLIQSGNHDVPFRQFTLPIDRESTAGYAAATGETLNIGDAYRVRNRPFQLDRDFDRRFGYRTRSMLVVPMSNQKDEVIGVLQLMNAHRGIQARSATDAEAEGNADVISFSPRSQNLARSLASQAGVALENNLLYRDIQRLFEGFVKASVTAIESRDPSTCGHSERVAALTVGLAEQVDRADAGPFLELRFSRQDIQELRYASLLHDFGKVGVREHVLVKAKKLYPSQLELVQERFKVARRTVELESARSKLDVLLGDRKHDVASVLAAIEASEREDLARLDEFVGFILRVNEPSHQFTGVPQRLAEIAGSALGGRASASGPLLRPEEVQLLSIPKGTLDAEEREEIQSHVVHSFRFLSQIPWTRELKRIPDIAKAHHEKLDGSGYPYHLKADEIPCQAKMMTIADIFDALTASDRPYKRAVPVERALDIIGQEVKSQLLDPALFQLFVDAKVYQLTAPIR